LGVEDQYAQTIAIVYPAVAPADEYALPIDKDIQTHVTINVLGEIPEVAYSKDELVATLRTIEWEDIAEAEVNQLDLFGVSNDFLVILLDAPALHNNWKLVNDALANAGIFGMNEYPNYRPHITLREKYDGDLMPSENLPDTVKLGSPTLWWGKETISLS
jgi:2'-5' RNA ligase